MTEGQVVMFRIKNLFHKILFLYGFVKTSMRVHKDIVKGLVKETSLTKKEAKKIANTAMDVLEDAYDDSANPELFENPIELGLFTTNMIMIRSIRSNENYSEEVHQYCDDDVEGISEIVNDVDSEDVFTVAEKKVLDGMIARYMNSFDKFRVSKKYNGIWY